jgi:hypothetical protein
MLQIYRIVCIILLSSIPIIPIRDGNVFARQVQSELQSEHQQGQTEPQHFAIQKTSSFVDETNFMHVYGELKNISNKAMKNVVVTALFYDSNGKLINEFRRSSELRTVNPGEISPFEVLYIDTKTVNAVKNYTLSAAGQETEMKARALRITSNSSKLDLTGVYYVKGRVVNEGLEDATNSMIIATLYDKDGKVAVVGRAQTEPVNISSHSEAAFDLPVTEALQTYKVKSYSLLADSDQYVVIPEFSQAIVMELLFLTFTVAVILNKATKLAIAKSSHVSSSRFRCDADLK